MTADEVAAGAIVWRGPQVLEPEILLIHRPKYDDWSFPKGKLDPGEHRLNAAVREVGEETGVWVTLGPPLPSQRYQVSPGCIDERTKTVYYWQAHVAGSSAERASAEEVIEADEEVDDLAWVPLSQADEVLTNAADRHLLAFLRPVRTVPLVVLRHAAATPRSQWSESDDTRGLTPIGVDQAERLGPILAAYGITQVVSSPAARCLDTVRGYAATTGVAPRVEPGLGEGADPERTHQVLRSLLTEHVGTVVCTHRPTLPAAFEVLGMPVTRLEPAGFVVLHQLERGYGGYVAAEQHHL